MSVSPSLRDLKAAYIYSTLSFNFFFPKAIDFSQKSVICNDWNFIGVMEGILGRQSSLWFGYLFKKEKKHGLGTSVLLKVVLMPKYFFKKIQFLNPESSSTIVPGWSCQFWSLRRVWLAEIRWQDGACRKEIPKVKFKATVKIYS